MSGVFWALSATLLVFTFAGSVLNTMRTESRRGWGIPGYLLVGTASTGAGIAVFMLWFTVHR